MPQLWIWLGDVMYADKLIIPPYFETKPMDEVDARYHRNKFEEPYSALR